MLPSSGVSTHTAERALTHTHTHSHIRTHSAVVAAVVVASNGQDPGVRFNLLERTMAMRLEIVTEAILYKFSLVKILKIRIQVKICEKFRCTKCLEIFIRFIFFDFFFLFVGSSLRFGFFSVFFLFVFLLFVPIFPLAFCL